MEEFVFIHDTGFTIKIHAPGVDPFEIQVSTFDFFFLFPSQSFHLFTLCVSFYVSTLLDQPDSLTLTQKHIHMSEEEREREMEKGPSRASLSFSSRRIP